MKFKRKQIKKTDEANNTTIESFYILVWTSTFLLFSYIHIKLSLKQQIVYKQRAIRMVIVKVILGSNNLAMSKKVKA